MADVYAVLVPELTNDPLQRGYAGMTDAERLASLTAKTRTRRVDTTPGRYSEWLTASGVRFKLMDAADSPDTPKAVKQRVEVVFGIERNPHLQSVGHALGDALGAFLHANGVVSQADRDAFVSITSQAISRAEELGLSNLGLGHMASARTMMGG